MTTLRTVKPTERAPRKRPKSVTRAASVGTPRELLVAIRTRLAREVEDLNTPARDLAALTRRLLEVTRDIEAIDAREEAAGEEGGPVGDEAFDPTAV